MKLRMVIAAAAALFIVMSAAPARADVVLTPYIGSLFGGDLPDGKTTYGATAAFMGGGIFGVEVGYNWTPKFVPGTDTHDDVAQMSLMGNLIVGIPIGGRPGRPHPAVRHRGRGLFRATAKQSDFLDRINSNDFAVNFGGGVMAFFTDHVGIRGDLRYFRTLRDEDAGSGLDDLDFELGDLNFWKWDVGAAFRF